MYHLKRNDDYARTASLPQVRGAVAKARALLEDASTGLVFDPAEHRYHLHGVEMRSVSSIVEHFAPFDKVGVATRCSQNPRHQHYGKSPEEIIAIWEADGRQAADAGTQVHAFGEACCLYMQGREQEIEEAFRDRLTSEGLAAVSPKEEAVARWWAETDWRRYTVVAKETRIVDPELGYAGTFDLLLLDVFNWNHNMRDYKTNKDLEKWYGEMLLPPLSMIRSNDIGKYTVQQTLYSRTLRRIGLNVATNQLIWLREDALYQNVDLPMNYDRVITYAVRQMNAQPDTKARQIQ